MKNLLLIGLILSSILIGNQAYAQYDNTTIFRMSEVTIITERHTMTAAEKVNGEISMTWNTAITLIVNEIVVPEKYRTWFTFAGTPFELRSNENIQYTLETTRQFCDAFAGITIDCIAVKKVLRIPIVISLQYKNTTFDSDSEIIIDLSDQNISAATESPLTIVAVVGGIGFLLGIAYYEKARRRKIHF